MADIQKVNGVHDEQAGEADALAVQASLREDELADAAADMRDSVASFTFDGDRDDVDHTSGAPVERELVLFKVQASPERRHEVIEIANVFRAKVVDVGKNTLTIEATGVASKLDAMENLFRAYGIRQLTRTGMVAMGRGHDA